MKLAPLALLLLTGCSHSPFRNPAQAAPTPPELSPDALKGAKIVASQAAQLTDADCVPYLKAFEGKLEAIEPARLPSDVPLLPLVSAIWEIRVALHSRLPSVGASCAAAMRDTLRVLRFAEDLLAERAAKVPDLSPDKIDFTKEPRPILDSAPNFLTLNTSPASDGPFAFRPGDIMIARGPSFLSAIISRVGDISSQFSHVILLDVEGDKTQTIEAYVGKGVGFYPIDEALRNENARLLVLRPRDPELGRRAAATMIARAGAAIASGHPIPYDYKLDFHDHSAMSCAEVAQVAYEDASGGAVELPFYPTKLTSDERLLGRFGMSQGETFTPGDLEVDPRFEMVLEWRDLSLTRDSRQKDAILTSLLNWANQNGYVLHDSDKSWLTGHVIYHVRRGFLWPLVKKILKIDDFSKEIPRKTLQTMELMNELGEDLLVELQKRDAAFEARTGWPMTYKDMYDSLEDLRREDAATYADRKTRKKALFHALFRP
jgi:hypothetical protein